jgi:hypothetical protein
MIELQDDRVALTAVDAGVLGQVGEDGALIRASRRVHVPAKAGALGLVLGCVPRGVDRREAVAAPRLERILTSPTGWEGDRRLELAASRAPKMLTGSNDSLRLWLSWVKPRVPCVLVRTATSPALGLALAGVRADVEVLERLDLAARPALLGGVDLEHGDLLLRWSPYPT